MSETNRIRIVIVDDFEDIRNFFKTTFSREADFEVVGTASSAREAVDVVVQTLPDIVLMDIEMETPHAGIDAIRAIKDKYPDIKFIVLTIHEDDGLLFSAYGAGAMDYVIKTSSIVDIITAIRNVYTNTFSIRPGVAKKLIQEFSRLKSEQVSLIYTLNLVSKLTNAELDILKAIYNGNSYKQIAKARCVEETTIRTQVNKILKKFEMKSMKDIIALLKELNFFNVY